MNSAEKSLRHICGRIEAACAQSGRNRAEIALVGASKTVSAQRLQEFGAAGLKAVGENYVQEAIRKQSEIESASVWEVAESSTRFGLEWHFIGALQSNKARDVVGRFSLIHSVDRARLAQALSDAARAQDVVQNVLLQVNLGDEASKAGCAVSELLALWQFCQSLPNLKVRGLMCLPPAGENAESARIYFRRLRELRDELNESSTRNGVELAELSMGMTSDYEIAIEEGHDDCAHRNRTFRRASLK